MGLLGIEMRIFTVLLTGFLLGLTCSASAVEGTFLYLENHLSQPITSEPCVKPTLVTKPQTGLSTNKLVFLENQPNPGVAFPLAPSGASSGAWLAPLTSGLAVAVSVLPTTESESEFAEASEGAKSGTPHFPSYLTEEDILECSMSYHGQPLKLTRAAFLRLDIDGEEWFGIMSDELPAPPPRNLVTALTELYTALEITDICNDLLSGRHETPQGVFRMGVPEPASWVLLLLALLGGVYGVSRKSK